jgi:hypothetical protein
LRPRRHPIPSAQHPAGGNAGDKPLRYIAVLTVLRAHPWLACQAAVGAPLRGGLESPDAYPSLSGTRPCSAAHWAI